MGFPSPEFTFQQDDQDLVGYLLARQNCAYLSDATSKLLGKLQTASLADHKTDLMTVWPMVLTDALHTLKGLDTREFGRETDGAETFFVRESLGIPELEDVLKAFSEFESLMYGARPDRYRDHLVHAFRVWIIGQGLMKACFGGALLYDGQDPVNDANLKIAPAEWEAMWGIVSLCHDVGYPLGAVDGVNARARRTFQKQGLEAIGDLRFDFSAKVRPLQDTLIRIMASRVDLVDKPNCGYLTHLQNKYYLKFLNSFDRLHHGIVSALLVARALVYFRESDYSHDNVSLLSQEDARQFLIRREILRAIAAHTCPDIYHLRFNTLAFLLFIVDEIQGGGRPTFEEYVDGAPCAGESATVHEFSEKTIRIQIEAKNLEGEIAKHRLVGLATRLRSAVDTKLLQKLTFDFAVMCKSGTVALRLADGKLTREGF